MMQVFVRLDHKKTLLAMKKGWDPDYDYTADYPGSFVVSESPHEITIEIFTGDKFYGNDSIGDRYRKALLASEEQ